MCAYEGCSKLREGFVTYDTQGPGHQPQFTARVCLRDGSAFSSPQMATKKQAERDVLRQAVEYIQARPSEPSSARPATQPLSPLTAAAAPLTPSTVHSRELCSQRPLWCG